MVDGVHASEYSDVIWPVVKVMGMPLLSDMVVPEPLMFMVVVGLVQTERGRVSGSPKYLLV